MATSFVSERTALVRRNPWILGLAATPLGLALADVVAAAALRTPQLMVVVPHLLGLGVALVIYAWRKNAYAREVPGRLQVDEDAVRFGGEPLVARRDLKSAVVVPRGTGMPVVRLRPRGARLAKDVRVADREEGRAVLRALGFDASQSVATFALPSRVIGDAKLRKWFSAGIVGMFALAGVLVAVLSRVMPNAPALLPFAFIAVGLASAALSLARTKLRVGADGLHLSWLRRSRFVAFGDVARIDVFEETGGGKNRMVGIDVRLKSGERVRIPVQQRRATIRDELDIVYERVFEALETWSRGEGVAHAAQVRRGGREAAEWVRALRGIGAFANVDARTAPVLPERLWRIVEDPAAPADARAGAAVALGHSADAEGRARLRAVAEATAAPKLRVAIESAASSESDSDEALMAALAEMEGEAAPAEKRA